MLNVTAKFVSPGRQNIIIGDFLELHVDADWGWEGTTAIRVEKDLELDELRILVDDECVWSALAP